MRCFLGKPLPVDPRAKINAVLSIARVSSRPRVPVLRLCRESIDCVYKRRISHLSQASARDKRNIKTKLLHRGVLYNERKVVDSRNKSRLATDKRRTERSHTIPVKHTVERTV